MLEALLQQTTIPLLEKVAAFGQKRHEVLAGNIANIDTPDYRTRDLPMQDFEKALQLAVQARRQNNVSTVSLLPAKLQDQTLPASPQTSLHAHNQQQSQEVQPIEQFFDAHLFQASASPNRNLTFMDGGNRSIELESMEMTKNASLQSFAIEVMLAQMRMLETAISERAV